MNTELSTRRYLMVKTETEPAIPVGIITEVMKEKFRLRFKDATFIEVTNVRKVDGDIAYDKVGQQIQEIVQERGEI